jgi:hypothetical protein
MISLSKAETTRARTHLRSARCFARLATEPAAAEGYDLNPENTLEGSALETRGMWPD